MQIIENIFDTFTDAENLFGRINEENNPPQIRHALIVLLLTNIVFFTLKYEFSIESFGAFLPKLVMSCLGGVILWYIVGGFFEFIASISHKSGKLKQIMCCFAYALLPIILFAPIQLLKPIGQTGYFLAVLFEIILYFWSVYLMAKAIEITYNLTFSRAVMIIFLPIICSFISIFWLIEFFSKMIYIFKL